MAALSLSINAIRPLNRWDHSSIRPGVVGSVGDVNLTPRLKSTFPGDFRWDMSMYGDKESEFGTSVNNGTHTSFVSGGGPAKTIDSNWGGRRRFETAHGWRYQDMRAPDKRVEPVMGATPQYGWRNRIATVNRARTTGDLFPIPAGGILQGPNGVSRGGQYPRVTDVVAGDTTPGFTNISSSSGSSNPNYKPSASSFGGAENALEIRERQEREGRSHVLSRMR